jgi:hypothetical protein
LVLWLSVQQLQAAVAVAAVAAAVAAAQEVSLWVGRDRIKLYMRERKKVKRHHLGEKQI